MGQLGNQNTGFTFSISGSFGDVAGGSYTVPSPGITVSQLHAFAGNNGASDTARLYVWIDSSGKPGAWLIRSGTFGLPGSVGWNARTDLSGNSGQGVGSDLYLPTGTKIWIGYYSSTGKSAFQGDGGSGTTELGNTADGNWNDHGPATAGQGRIAAYLDYTPLPAPNITGVSPSAAPAGATVTLTGSHFLETTSISVNGVTASAYTINSDTSITLTIPAGASGAGSIVVTNPAGNDSIAFVAGQIYADSGTAFASGVLGYADNGTTWVQSGVQVWADDGASPTPQWHQIG